MDDATMLTDECIEWDGPIAGQGYGAWYHDGTMDYVHRLAWAETNGPIPNGMQVLHKCDNPPCFLVDHLFLGTQSVNMRDMTRKGRSFKARLTEEEISEIKEMWASGHWRQRELAEQYGVSRGEIGHIVNGRVWSWL